METWSIIMPPEGVMDIPMADVSKIKRKYLDIPYAFQSPNQKLDIYLPPEGDGPFPTVIFVHGGAFIMGDKRDAQLLQALHGINRGYAVASVEYRLAGEAKYPAGLFDAKAAVRFLRANAPRYMLDGDRFALLGDSAGGHYIVMAAATQKNQAFEDFSMGNASYSSAVQAVASRFGVYDFVIQREKGSLIPPEADPNFEDIEKALFGAASNEITGLMHFTNVLHFVTEDFPPLLLQHGSGDKTVNVTHSILLEEKVRAVCGTGRAELVIMDGYDHGGVDLRWDQPENDDMVFDFFDKHLK
jgi:acetyl esterase/lipase